MITVGSLFDGIGGFPLAAERAGIVPVWASEIEKAPIEITKKHFPNMKHLGDINDIDGGKIDPVDIITFGSPCQDLSIGKDKRRGLKGERSGLFRRAIDIVRQCELQQMENTPDLSCGKMLQGRSAVTKEWTFELSLKKSDKPTFQCLQKINGQQADWLNCQTVKLRGEHLTLNFGVSPSEEKESSLSQILQADVPTKYYLSEKACLGILRRAELSGKHLPELLKQALEERVKACQQFSAK